MLERLLTTKALLAITGLVLLWLLVLWMGNNDPSGTEGADQSRLEQNRDNTMVSSIQPIANAATATPDRSDQSDGSSNALSIAPIPAADLNEEQNRRLHEEFKQAVAEQQAGNAQTAIDQYKSLINEFPGIPENYVNLANLLGAQGELQQARDVLSQGVAANRKASILMQGLQSVHGALAAQAYRRALDVNTPEQKSASVALPVVFELQTGLDAQDQIKRLEDTLSEQLETVEGSSQLASEYQQKIQSLEQQLAAQEQNSVNTATAQTDQISALQQQLSQANELLTQSQTAEREALARVVRAEQDAKSQVEAAQQELSSVKTQLSDQESSYTAQLSEQEARFKTQIDQQQVALGNAEKEKQELLAAINQRDQRIAATTTSVPVAVVTEPDTASVAQQADSQEQQAIERVQSWAKAWSEQNVSAYVSHYADEYSSSPAISREQWLQQRRVRLTNKQFINVKVSLFKVEDMGARFAVTFRQHYKSDVIDDVIFKRLVFEKLGSNWAMGKIISERVVSPS